MIRKGRIRSIEGNMSKITSNSGKGRGEGRRRRGGADGKEEEGRREGEGEEDEIGNMKFMDKEQEQNIRRSWRRSW